MKAKKVKWTQKPMTWGGYFKFAGISAVVSILITVVSMIPYLRYLKSFRSE